MMSTPLLSICLVVATICLLVITVSAVLLARDMRRAARRIDAVLSHAESAVRQVGTLTTQACTAVAHAFDVVTAAQQAASSWMSNRVVQRLGHGAGPRRPRRNSRSA